MTLQQLKDFFKKKPSYIKKGAAWLSNFLEISDISLIKKAKREVKKELLNNTLSSDNPPNLQLKSKWQVQKKGGKTEWFESYKAIDEPDYKLTKEDWKGIINNTKDITTTYIKKTKLPSNNKSLIIWTSDKHIGASIPDDSLYKKKYDKHIFFKRMKHIFDRTIELFQIYGSFDQLIVADLGDSLDGYDSKTTRGGHHLPQNLNNKEAAKVHFYTHKWFYESLLLSGIAKKFNVIHISNDNHAGDFGWQASFALQQYGTIAFPDINFLIPEEFLSHFILYNRAYIITHGKDKKNRKYGMPLKINADTESFIMDYAMDRNLASYKIHVRKGDLHMNDLDCSRNKMTYWNIGSIFGASDWIMDNFGVTKPSCVFEIVEKDSDALSAQIFPLY